MARRTKEQLRKDRNEKRITDLLSRVKYLREPKYFKTNYWSMAHWESWAAKGKNGSCGCGCGYYSGSLCNKRHRTDRGGRKSFCSQVVDRLCGDCIRAIETRLNVNFKKDYAP
jgi:hypothetical protein